MRVIATGQNKDGTYDAVGMNNRTIIDLKTITGIKCRARKLFPNRNVKLEVYGDRIYGEPTAVIYIR